MAVNALRLRSMPATEALARERLGAGRSLSLSRPQPATLHLRLAPAPFSQPPANALDCACGRLWLDDAQALLSQLSSCPALVAEPQANDWYWPLYNHCLAPELQSLLSPVQLVPAPADAGLDCLLELHAANGSRHISQARIAPQVLLRLLDQGPWQPVPRTGNSDWPLRLPLLLGRCPLNTAQIASLRPGDVVLAEQPLFNPEGLGRFQVGHCCLHLRLLPGASLRFTLIELEDLPMNASLDHFALSDHETPSTLDAFAEPLPTDDEAPARFDDLPLNLTLRAGHLTLSLGQLRQLTVGSVLDFAGCAPGQALLCQGERPLARGELVDIDGRLGLQITALEAPR